MPICHIQNMNPLQQLNTEEHDILKIRILWITEREKKLDI